MLRIEMATSGIAAAVSPHALTLTGAGRELSYPMTWERSSGRLYVLFSLRCNIRCVYCFQNGHERPDSALDEDGLVRLMRDAQGGVREVVLFGGEPLLAENLSRIGRVLEEFDHLRFICFTNGNFGSDYLDLLADYSYAFERVVITLDGPRSVHDARRVNPRASSYDLATDNLRALRARGVPADVQVNVDVNNLSSIGELLDELCRVGDTGGMGVCLNPVKYVRAACGPLDLCRLYLAERRRHPGLDLSLNLRCVSNLERLLCHEPMLEDRCGLAGTSVLDLPNGRVYACPQNSCSTIGSIEGDRATVDRGRIARQVEETAFCAGRCAGCELKAFCMHCCPYVPTPDGCRESVEEVLAYLLDNARDLRGGKRVREILTAAPPREEVCPLVRQ